MRSASGGRASVEVYPLFEIFPALFFFIGSNAAFICGFACKKEIWYSSPRPMCTRLCTLCPFWLCLLFGAVLGVCAWFFPFAVCLRSAAAVRLCAGCFTLCGGNYIPLRGRVFWGFSVALGAFAGFIRCTILSAVLLLFFEPIPPRLSTWTFWDGLTSNSPRNTQNIPNTENSLINPRVYPGGLWRRSGGCLLKPPDRKKL